MYAYALPVISAECLPDGMLPDLPLYRINGLGFAPATISGPKGKTFKVLFFAITEAAETGAHHAEVVVIDPAGNELQQLDEDQHPIRSIHEWTTPRDWTLEARTFDLNVNVFVEGVFFIALKIDDSETGRWPLLVIDTEKLPKREK